MKDIQSRTIVFLTGAFVHSRCWNNWKLFFEQEGYACLAPPWPSKEADPEILRSRYPNDAIAQVTLPQVIEHYASIIESLPEKPIVIGHSLGGLLAQLFLDRDLVAAAVAIHSLPPQGIFPTQFSFLRSTWHSLGILSSLNKSYLMSFKTWQYAFTNSMAMDDQQAAYNEYAIPESKRAIRGGLTRAARVNFKKPRAPLLLTAGDADHCIPAALNRANYRRYRKNGSVINFKSFSGRNHFVLGQDSWREDARFILHWLNEKQEVSIWDD